MFAALLHIKNYKLFVVNMMLLGMGLPSQYLTSSYSRLKARDDNYSAFYLP